ncbi:MAG TPA: sodium-dependent transporter, partial [Spirochaetaceae bacterium]|nr:sodium-dependent transporter [Spirochaetaceae bacterium]
GSVEMWFVIYAAINIIVIWFGVENGIERVSKFLMPVLVALALFIAIYSSTRPGAAAGIRYFLVPDFSNFSIMTLVAAFGQMFYSMSIAMGILITYGSYMKKDVNIETSSYQIAAFDTGVAILGGFMIIPAVFAFSGGDVNALLQKGPSLTFVTLPKVFLNMKGGQFVAVCFFFMFFLAALTSSISLFETCISTVGDETRLSRRKSIAAVCLITLALGTMSAFGYGIWDKVRIAGMQFLDFFDFLSNSIMLPIASLFTVVLILAHVGVDRIKGEVLSSSPFKSKRLYDLVIRFVAPPVIAIVLVSSILDAFGVLKI